MRCSSLKDYIEYLNSIPDDDREANLKAYLKYISTNIEEFSLIYEADDELPKYEWLNKLLEQINGI